VQVVIEVAWRKSCLKAADCIDEVGLRNGADRRGAIEGRGLKRVDPSKRLNGAQSAFDGVDTRAEITAETEIDEHEKRDL